MNTQQIEKRVCDRLVRDILAAGCVISVHDGGCFVVKRSDHRDHIVDAMRSTDEDTLVIYNAAGERLGSVLLVYGNGCDVISDYSYTDATERTMEGLLKGAVELGERV